MTSEKLAKRVRIATLDADQQVMRVISLFFWHSVIDH
jgi:hypothetical protein